MSFLLEKTRNINKLLQTTAGNPVDFTEVASVLCAQLAGNCYIVNRNGEILGYSFFQSRSCEIIDELINSSENFSKDYNVDFLRIIETRSNYDEIGSFCVFMPGEKECIMGDKTTTVVPIIGGGQRLGTLVIAKFDGKFTDEDLVLAEYGATVIGMEIIRSKAEKVEEEARKKAAVNMALNTLSYSELEAVEHIFEELDGDEGVLIASNIADKAGITRSVIVNALRKFESAGVIESKSLGMKGTYIKILNDNLLEDLEKTKR